MSSSTKRASVAALCVLLTVCISPLQAFAATSVNVGGTDYTKAANGSGSAGGTWAWDGTDGMALNNYNGGSIVSAGDLDITLSGANTITSDYVNANSNTFGVHAEDGDISISGNGSLDVNSGSTATGISDGIEVNSGDVSISGTTVNLNATSTTGSAYGIYVYDGNVTITDSTVTANATSPNTTSSAYLVGIQAYGEKSGQGIINITGSDVIAKASGATKLERHGIATHATSDAGSAPQVVIANSSVVAEGDDGAILSASANSGTPGIITITGSSIVAPTGAHVQDVADSGHSLYGQTIGTGEGTITQFWLDGGDLNPDVATSVAIARAHNASQTSPKTADEAPIALLVLSLATAGGALFVSRRKMAR